MRARSRNACSTAPLRASSTAATRATTRSWARFSDLLDWAISAVNANDEVEAFSDIEDEWEAREAVGYALGRRAQARR